VFLHLQKRLEPCGIIRFSTEGWGVYARPITSEHHHVGQTQKSERKPVNLRTRITRLGRRTLCCVTTTTIHDLVIGLCIHREQCGLLI